MTAELSVYVLDDVEDASDISVATMGSFFGKFIKEFSDKYADIFIRMPEGEQEIKDVTDVYEKLGMPGCIGSMDCTHFHWEKCPVWLYNDCKGKYPWPTLVVEAIVNHHRRFMSISPAFAGSNNDINVSYADKTVQRIREEGLYEDITFKIYTAEGVRLVKGLYLLTDGGYNEWRCFMYPEQDPCAALKRYSEWLESVRKDVECTFGILKGRFRLLKRGIELHSQRDVGALIKCCAIFHNLLLDEDETFIDIDWDQLCPPDVAADDAFDEDEESNSGEQRVHDDEQPNLEHPLPPAPSAAPEMDNLQHCEPQPNVHYATTHYTLKLALARHFNIAYGKGEVSWPKRNKKPETLILFEANEQQRLRQEQTLHSELGNAMLLLHLYHHTSSS